MAELGPAYLIHGDDHGAVAERRARLRALAEGRGGSVSVELLEGESGSPAAVAAALSAMTLAIGRRVIIVDGVERWREADVEEAIAPAMAQMPPDTTLAMFAREEARAKAPAALHKAVKGAGGAVDSEMTVKPWELPEVGPRGGRAPRPAPGQRRRQGPRRSGRPAPAEAAARARDARAGRPGRRREPRERSVPMR